MVYHVLSFRVQAMYGNYTSKQHERFSVWKGRDENAHSTLGLFPPSAKGRSAACDKPSALLDLLSILLSREANHAPLLSDMRLRFRNRCKESLENLAFQQVASPPHCKSDGRILEVLGREEPIRSSIE